MSKFEKLLEEENLIYNNQKPKYEMRLVHTTSLGTNVTYSELQFTSLTNFHFFLLSDHYGNLINRSDDRIIVVNLETDEIVFDTDKED